MNVLNKLLPLALSVFSPALVADTEFEDSVPLDVVMQFIGRSPLAGESKLYSDILDAFPPFTVPDEFTVLASADQGFSRRVILATTLDGADAGAAIRDAFVAEGWVELAEQGAPQVGFVATSAPQFATSLCHDAHGVLIVLVNPGADARYVSINQNLGARMIGRAEPTCAQLQGGVLNDPAFGIRNGLGPALSRYVPSMVMPLSSQPGAPQARIMSMSGSSNEWETDGALTIDWSVDEVFEHFATQIGEQGWQLDTSALGTQAAMGIWTRSVDGLDLAGTLSIVNTGTDNWEMRFRLLRREAADAQ